MKLSIIMAIYNAEQFLEQCLDSIIMQTMQDYELICVDDGSTDKTVDILNKYGEQYPQIRIFHHEHTGKGAAGARNMGMKYAKGKYVLFLDADDYFSEYLVEHTYRKAEETQADIVIYDIETFDSDTGNYIYSGNTLRREYLPPKEIFNGNDVKRHIYQLTVSAAWSMLFRREFIEKNQLCFQEIYGPDDQFFVFTALSAARRITVLNEKLLFYRKNTLNSQTANIHKSPLSIAQVYIELKKWLVKNDLFNTYCSAYYERALWNFRWYIRHMGTYEAYLILFDYLRDHGFKELEITEEILNQNKVPEELIRWFCDVSTKSGGEYAWSYMRDVEHKGVYEYRYKFPLGVFRENPSVILYGAGGVGRDFYMQNCLNQYCKIVAWVDKRADEYGAPIVGKQEISKVMYDKILIAVEQKETADLIRSELAEDGIEESRIEWLAPIGYC